MFQVRVKDSFSSAHYLNNYNGKCENLHGHNYDVELFLKGEKLNKTFMLEDFTVLKKDLKKLLNHLDHKNLNDIKFFKERNPTAEMIALYIYNELKPEHNLIYKVRIWETEKQYAEYFE